MPDITTLLASAAALGTASFGIVEGLKAFRPWGTAGFGGLVKSLNPLLSALKISYGDDAIEVMAGQYRIDRAKGALRKTIRQGVRIGLTEETAPQLASMVGNVIVSEDLTRVAAILATGKKLDDASRSILGRFELAVDARIDAAFARAERTYRASMLWSAMGVSVFLACLSAFLLLKSGEIGSGTTGFEGNLASYVLALMVGIIAVPIAPIAKDVTKAISAASSALKARK